MKKLNIALIVVLLSLLYLGCGEEGIIPLEPGRSDITRTGKFISFTSDKDGGDFDIFIAEVDANGNLVTAGTVYPSNPFNLTNSFNSADDKQSNWSPDGRMLVFSSTQGTSQEIYIFFFNPDGSIDSSISPNPKQLLSSGGNWDNNPAFSPDGEYLIWDRRYDNSTPSGVDTADSRDLYIGDVTDSLSSIHIANPRAVVTTTGADEYNPKWSVRISVRKIAYEYKGSVTSTDHDVYVIDPFDTTNNVNFYNPNNSGYPAWAPACDRIIFESDKSPGDYWKIVSLGYPTNNNNPADIAAVSNVHLRYPTWLPNGGLIAYIRFEPSTGKGNIYLVSSTGGSSFKLLQNVPAFDAANNLWPAW